MAQVLSSEGDPCHPDCCEHLLLTAHICEPPRNCSWLKGAALPKVMPLPQA